MWKLIKKHLPTTEQLSKQAYIGYLIKRLQRHPQLWSVNDQTMAKGVSIGLFVAFLPLPGQMMIAVLTAYLARANLPIAVALTWISNPFTFAPLNFGIYSLGKYLTGSHVSYHSLAEFSWDGASYTEIYKHISTWLLSLGKPFLVGMSVLAISSALLGYIVVYLGFKITRYWHEKKPQKARYNKN